jgi:hypothetical protein
VFAHEYADLTELDDEAHLVAFASSRIEAIDNIGGSRTTCRAPPCRR